MATTGTDRFGKFTAGDATRPGYCPQLLVVFVHGILGSATGTWPQVPHWILGDEGVSADTFSFAYPAGLQHSGSIGAAARDLREWLSVEAREYRHLVFITHSNGGLVVKELLRRDYAATWKIITTAKKEGAIWEFDALESLTLRTRFVAHIAVPHLGGNRLLTWPLLLVYHLLFLATFPLLYLCRLLTLGHLHWGYQSIYTQLRPGSGMLRKMEAEYEAGQRRFDEAGLPRPVVFDIAAGSDLAVARNVLSAEEWEALQSGPTGDVKLVESDQTRRILSGKRVGWTLRGTHFSVKLPEQSHDPIITLLGRLLQRFRPPGLWGIAYWTIARVSDHAQALGVHGLIEAAPEDAVEKPLEQPLSELAGCSQAEACQQLLDFIRHTAAGPQSLVLTGPAGVGKSSVIREFARFLSLDFMLRDGALPIILPLQDIRFAEVVTDGILGAPTDRQSERFFHALLEDWCVWASGIIHPLSIQPGELSARFQKGRVVVVFDSVDEFLLNNPRFELLHFRLLRDHLVAIYRSNDRLRLVFGVRETLLGYREMATRSYLVAVAPLTKAQIGRLGHAALFEKLAHSEVGPLLRIPLYLRALDAVEREVNRNPATSLTTTRVMQILLEALVEKSELTKPGKAQSRPIETQEWLNALTIAGWLFFRKFHRGGRVAEQSLRAEAAELHKSWLDHHAQFAVYPEFQELPGAATELTSFLAAFRLFAEDFRFAALRDRTIFLRSGTTGSEELRIWHREALDFLVARYLATCIRTGLVEQLARRGFTSKLFGTAGELLHDYTIDAPLVLQVLKRTEEARARGALGDATFIIGNFSGLLANLRSPITGPALGLIFDERGPRPPVALEFPAVALHVLLDGCGYRALLAAPDDHSAAEICSAVVPIFLDCVSGRYAVNAVTVSAAWCYLAAFARRPGASDHRLASFRAKPPPYPEALLRLDESQMDAALWLVWIMRDQDALDPRDRSLQVAFIEVQQFVLTVPERAISTVHYLCAVATAYRRNKYCEEVLKGLKPIFAASSAYEQNTKAFSLVPELDGLFQVCRAVYRRSNEPA